MTQALAAILLQSVMSVPISTSMSISTPYERATLAAPTLASPTVAAPTIAGTTASNGQPTSEQVPAREDIIVRRGAKISYESVPKTLTSK